MVGIAWATTACYFLWYMYASRKEFTALKSNKREWLLIISHVLVFYVTANGLNLYVGFLVYAVYLVAILLIKRTELTNIFRMIQKMDQ